MLDQDVVLRTFIIVIYLTVNLNCDARSIVEYCENLPESTLTVILGSAYNPRYMSIDKPSSHPENNGYKRSSYEGSFSVDENYHYEISDQPAWEIEHVHPRRATLPRRRRDDSSRDVRQAFLERVSSSRSSKAELFKSRPWECEAKIRWIDMGPDYFPRYIRNVECTRKECWYGHFVCKARSFTVKVLRRRNGECVRTSEKLIFASRDQVTGEFTELWVWEEKALNFCCDCVMDW